MAVQFKMDLQGNRSLQQKFDLVKDFGSVRAAENALRAGARVIAQKMREVSPVQTGHLRRSIAITEQRGGFGDLLDISVGPTAPHAHLVEFGTVERFRRPPEGSAPGRQGSSTGIMPASLVFTTAFNSIKGKASRVVSLKLWDSILQALVAEVVSAPVTIPFGPLLRRAVRGGLRRSRRSIIRTTDRGTIPDTSLTFNVGNNP